MKSRIVLLLACCLSYAQDTVAANVTVWGDFLRVRMDWWSSRGFTPLGANFVLSWPQPDALAWDSVSILERGSWGQAPLYRDLYITQRRESSTQRVSLNVLPQQTSQGLALPSMPALIGTYLVPIRRFGDTLQPAWAMESGEIVGLGLVKAKGQFSFKTPPAAWLCPAVEGFRIRVATSGLGLEAPAPFRPENLTISWYRDGSLVGQGPELLLNGTTPGTYYAQITHRCGRTAYSDSLVIRTAGLASVQAGWRLYPQPAVEVVYLEPGGSGPIQYEIIDGAGRRWQAGSLDARVGTAIPLSLKDLPVGLYVLSIRTAQEQLNFTLSHVW